MREAQRYLQNAKEILKKAPIEDNRYADVKYVQEACSTAYLAVLKTIDAYLLKKGIDEKKLPQSINGYREMLRKHAMIHDGKILKSFEALYKELHIAGYYRGLLIDVNVVKEVFKSAKGFIEKIG